MYTEQVEEIMSEATAMVRVRVSLKERVGAIADMERRSRLEVLSMLVEEAIVARAKT